MKAAILHTADSVPVYGEFDEPVAGPGREIVELVASGIHQQTRSVATGRHYGSGRTVHGWRQWHGQRRLAVGRPDGRHPGSKRHP